MVNVAVPPASVVSPTDGRDRDPGGVVVEVGDANVGSVQAAVFGIALVAAAVMTVYDVTVVQSHSRR